MYRQVKHIDVKEALFNGTKPPDFGLPSSSPAAKLLQHTGQFSAGLRVRTHPSLQSEKIGFVPVKGIIGYTDEVREIRSRNQLKRPYIGSPVQIVQYDCGTPTEMRNKLSGYDGKCEFHFSSIIVRPVEYIIRFVLRMECRWVL